MEEVLMWVALAILLGLLVVGVQALGHGGQALLIKTEFVAYGLTSFGITNPTVAWLVLGILVGGAVGFAVGFGRAGRKMETAFACVTTPALLVLLSVLSSSAPKPESPQVRVARTTLAALTPSQGERVRWNGVMSSRAAVLETFVAPGTTTPSGVVTYEGVKESVNIYVESDGSVFMQGTSYRRLKGKGTYNLDRFRGKLLPERISMEGVYADTAGRGGQWKFSRANPVKAQSVARNDAPPSDVSHIDPAYRAAIQDWLQRNPVFGRPAVMSDCSMCQGGRLPQDWGWDNKHPYYAAGDFNKDGQI